MYYYKVFGLTVSSQLGFVWPLERIQSPFTISCEILQASDPIIEKKWDLFYTSPLIDPETFQPKIKIFSSAQGILLSYPSWGRFEILSDKIKYDMHHKFEQQVFETALFRVAFVLWLELAGISVLHASGVVIRNSAIGFLANSTTGKSTLAAAFVRSGAKFLTDDILPVEARIPGYQARPSYAWLHLLPEAAAALSYGTGKRVKDGLEKFAIRLDENFGEFCSNPVPLAALYLPVRREDVHTISVEALSSKQAYLGLLQHTFIGEWLMKSHIRARSLDFFTHLIKEVPIKRLIYPSGYEHLPAVVEAINQDLDI